MFLEVYLYKIYNDLIWHIGPRRKLQCNCGQLFQIKCIFLVMISISVIIIIIIFSSSSSSSIVTITIN